MSSPPSSPPSVPNNLTVELKPFQPQVSQKLPNKLDGGAQEDDDFVALRESRTNRKEEEFVFPEEQADDGVSSSTASNPSSGDVHKERPNSTKILESGNSIFRWRKQNLTPWEQLKEACFLHLDKFKKTRKELKDYPLSSPELRDPVDNSNILHFALRHKAEKAIIDYIIHYATTELLQQQFDVTVCNITDKKNALQQMVERNDIKRLERILKKLPQECKLQCLLKEARVQVSGHVPRGGTCLHLAAFYGHTEMIKYLLEKGIDVNHQSSKKDTALLWASRWGKTECVKVLLEKGANTAIVNDRGSTALYWAVRFGHLETVKLLVVDGKADVNQKRKLGLVVPIVLACALGHEEIAKVLLDHGADPNFTIRAGERPLHHASKEGYAGIVELLLSRGAGIDNADHRGDTPLLLAAKYGHAKAMHTLLKHDASLDIKNLMGESVWDLAASSNLDIITKILVMHELKEKAPTTADTVTNSTQSPTKNSKDGSVNEEPQCANTLLFLSASNGTMSRLKLLFNMGIEAGVTDENGNTFLHHAAKNGQAAVIREYHKTVNIDGGNNFGNTPLHEACTMGQHDSIVELITAKAMANVRNKKGETALHVAAYSNIIQPTSVSSLMEYVCRTHPYECLNIKDKEGNSCLHIAARWAKPEVLWEFRFVRFKDEDVDGNLPLHESVRKGEPECLQVMLDIYDAMKRDCDINHQTRMKETVLSLAAREGFIEGVRRLLLYRADISVGNLEGNTILHTLTQLVVDNPMYKNIYLEIIHIVLEHACLWYSWKNDIPIHDSDKAAKDDIKKCGVLNLVFEIPNEKGLNVLDFACKLGAVSVVQILTNMEDVTVFKLVDGYLRYDITYLIPASSKDTHRSSLEWLLMMDNKQGVSPILDIQPFSDIEMAYSSVGAWANSFVIIIHILYMIFFTYTGVHLLGVERETKAAMAERNNTEGIDQDERRSLEIAMSVIVPIEPILIVLINVYTHVKMFYSGRMFNSKKLNYTDLFSKAMQVILYLVYSIFALLWIIFYNVDHIHKDYVLAVSLLIGWMISIVFTRGFKAIHYFWRMIQNMIIKDMVKFIVIYLIVLVAFSYAMHVCIQYSVYLSEQYPSPVDTMYMVFNLMLGMGSLFDDNLGQGQDSDRNTTFIKGVYVLYLVMATIILLNLLIAMMNDSYAEIKQRQSVWWRIESVQLGIDVESMIPQTFRWFSKVKLIRGFLTPMDKSDKLKKRYYIEVPELEFEQGMAEKEDRQVLADIQLSIKNIENKIAALKLDK